MKQTLTAVLAALLCFGCGGSKFENKQAVHEALVKHLSQRQGLEMARMDLEITQLVFKEGKAEADVMFRAKGAPESQGMSMHYTLTRSGDTWVVDRSAGHGEQGAPAPGVPGAGGAGQLPPGHPPAPTGEAPKK